MTKEMTIAIMMADGCTKNEAERYAKGDSTIWEDYKDYHDSCIDSCIGSFMDEDEIPTLEDIKARKVQDISFITFEGKDYIIEYCN